MKYQGSLKLGNSKAKNTEYLILTLNTTHSIDEISSRLPFANLADHFRYEHSHISLMFTVTENTLFTIINDIRSTNDISIEIDSDLLRCYDTISQWNVNDIVERTAKKYVPDCVGSDLLKWHDEKFLYGYEFAVDTNPHDAPDTLTKRLAYRSDLGVHINRLDYSIEEILYSLQELNRLPVIIAVDRTSPLTFDIIKRVYDFAHQNSKKMGVYYRATRNEDGAINAFIKEKELNHRVDETTDIVCIQRLPKFLVENSYQPRSMILIDSVRHPVSMFSNRCDLNILYRKWQN